MTEARVFNLGLLDKSIDDIEDLPGFEVPVNGVYSLKFSTALKVVKMKGKDADCVEANFEVIECLEQNDAEATPTKAGTKFSMLFNVENDIAAGKMKELLAPIAAHFQESDLAKLVTETCKDLIITATIKRRADKEDPDKFYPSVSNVLIA